MWRGVLGLILLLPFAATAQTQLRSPWDIAPRRVISAAYACPPLPPLPRDVVAEDDDADQQPAPFAKAMTEAAKAADTFQRSGSRAAARCVMDLLLAHAEAHAITGRLSGHQAIYLQGWTLGALTLAYLKARTAGTAGLDETRQIVRWLVDAAEPGLRYMDQRRAAPRAIDAWNNHAAWMGLTVMAVGVANNDDGLLAWGEARFREQVSQIQADGTLPLELARGRLALHDHLFAAAPLVAMAEFGEANGRGLYGVSDHALGRLVARCLAGLDGHERPSASELAWAWPYAHRFPGTALDDMGRAALFRPVLFLGGLPSP